MTVSSKHTFVQNVIAGAPKGREVGAQTKKKWGPRRVGARRVGGPKMGSPAFRALFSLSRHRKFVLSSLSGGGLLVELWPRDAAMNHPNCAFGGFSGSFCVSPAAPERGKKKAKLWAVRRWWTRGGGSWGGPRRQLVDLHLLLGHGSLRSHLELSGATLLPGPPRWTVARVWPTSAAAAPAAS